MRTTLRHDTDERMVAVYGVDPFLGFFAEVRRRGRLLGAYDNLRVPGGTSIQGVLDLLVEHGYFTQGDIAEAMGMLAIVDACDLPAGAVQRAGLVVERLRSAAARG